MKKCAGAWCWLIFLLNLVSAQSFFFLNNLQNQCMSRTRSSHVFSFWDRALIFFLNKPWKNAQVHDANHTFCYFWFLHNDFFKKMTYKSKNLTKWQNMCQISPKGQNDFRCIRYHKMLQNIQTYAYLRIVRAKNCTKTH